MEENIEKYGVAVIVVFGALVIGGLMAATISFGHRNGFLFSLGAATAAWVAGFTMVLNLPRVYGVIVAISILMALCATLSLVV
jgi:hypothetical protein